MQLKCFVSTYKSNSDILDIFYYFLKKNLCKDIKIYLSGNSKYKKKNIVNLSNLKEDNLKWSERTYKSLYRYRGDFIIYFQDDFILHEKTDRVILKKIVNIFKKKKFRLF